MTALAVAPRDIGDVPIDPAFLSRQVPGLASDHMAHYLAHGLAQRLDPTPWFVTDWYAWQNPDWSMAHAAPYLHYLDVGRREGRDPSPFVDIHQYRTATGGTVEVDAIYDLILRGYRSPALGVATPASLARQQRAFQDGIACLAHRARPLRHSRPSLVVLQSGRSSLAGRWYRDDGRDWDLLVNYYDNAGFRPGLGEYVFFQKGTKFSAMRLLLNRFPEIFRRYGHVLFLDDDILTSVDDLNRLFDACRTHDLDLAQMTLSAASSCNWDELFTRTYQSGPRPISAVEIMMPVLSQSALEWIKPTLDQSVSGFGLDLVWGKIVAESGGRIAVLDNVTAEHLRPVDQAGGAYYTYLRCCGINAKAELWTLIGRYGAARDLVTSAAG